MLWAGVRPLRRTWWRPSLRGELVRAENQEPAKMWAPPRRATISGVHAGAIWGWEVRSVTRGAGNAFCF